MEDRGKDGARENFVFLATAKYKYTCSCHMHKWSSIFPGSRLPLTSTLPLILYKYNVGHLICGGNTII